MFGLGARDLSILTGHRVHKVGSTLQTFNLELQLGKILPEKTTALVLVGM